MKKFVSILLVLLIMMGVFPLSAFGAENTTSELKKEISNILESAESDNGISVAISSGSDTLYQNSMGYENKESGIRVSEQTVFEWGSTTKLLVWVSVMQLVEKGQLDLNTSIQQYLPDNFLKNLSYEDPITMLDLMNHTAGFQETYIGAYVNQEVEETLENALKRNQPDQIYKPGEHLAYSNWGAALAGYIVERVSGQPFWEYVHQNIFNPLEMKHTALKVDFSDNNYVKQRRTQLKGYDIDGNEIPKSGYLWLYPAGGSAGTMEDFCKFSQALARKDNRLFSNSNMYEELYSSSLNYSDTQTSRIRHGFLTFKQSDLVIGHGGYALNGTTYIVFNPDTEQVLTVMTNEATEDVKIPKMIKAVFGENTKQSLIQEEYSTESLAGHYVDTRTIESGHFKIFSMFKIINLHAKSETELIETLQNGMKLHKAEGMQYQLDGYEYVNIAQGDQGQVLEFSHEEYRKISEAYWIMNITLLLGLAAATVYSLISYVINLIIKVIKKRKLSILDKMHLSNQSFVLIFIVNLLVMILRVQQYVIPAYTMQIVIFWALLAAIIIHSIIYVRIILKSKKINIKKIYVRCAIDLICGVLVIINLLFWRLLSF